jgi:hypothetical protein
VLGKEKDKDVPVVEGVFFFFTQTKAFYAVVTAFNAFFIG